MSIVIQVQNQSSVMNDSKATNILTAVSAQVKHDVAPAWGFDSVSLQFFSQGEELDPKQQQFLLVDMPVDTPDVAHAGAPIGYAFLKTTIEAGLNPSVTISHQLLALLGDSRIADYCIWSDVPSPLFLYRELCDPVEADDYAYETAGFPGIKVSNFVLPDYFVPNAKGPFDFMKVLTAPNTLAPGGYQITWDPKHGQRSVQDDKAPSKRLALGRPSSRARSAISPITRARVRS